MATEDPTPTGTELTTADGEVDYEALDRLLGDLVVERESHLNAEAFVVRPDDVQAALSALKEEAGFDHLSCLTSQEYGDRFESIYHLTKYADRTQEVTVVVPLPKEDPTVETAVPVFESANWAEREAYDLMGIRYEGHPDLRRILLPESWQGHPLRRGYDEEQHQVISYKKHANPLVDTGTQETEDEWGDSGESDTLFVNIGPHHPATHGVLHLKTVLDGEQVADVDPDIGYLHRCEEQMCQQNKYRHQIIPYADRWDYTANLPNEWAVARVIEDMADIEVPEYAQVLRTMSTELARMFGHFLAVATFALDVYGDFTVIFQYGMRDRERIQNILEDLTGQRMMFYYFRVGGVAWDLPEPREEFIEKTRDFLEDLPPTLEEYHDLLTNNELLQIRTVDTGILSEEMAREYGATGPVARGSGIDYDLRRDDPYGYYPELDWNVVTEDAGDNFARLQVRLREVEESARIVDQCLDLLEDWPEDERTLQSNVPRTLKPESDTEIYRAVENAKGELGIYVRSDGTQQPQRFKIRSPNFHNLSALPEMAEGELIPDLVASLGSLDIVLGEVDR